MRKKKICYWLACVLFLANLLTPGTSNSKDFPWDMFLPAIIVHPESAPYCNEKHVALCVTKADCLRFDGYWYDKINICSSFTTSDHLLVGSWMDSWGETYITYNPDGTYYGREFGEPFQGIWAPTSVNIVLRYSIVHDFFMTIILLNNSTYIYKDIPSLGEMHRIN